MLTAGSVGSRESGAACAASGATARSKNPDTRRVKRMDSNPLPLAPSGRTSAAEELTVPSLEFRLASFVAGSADSPAAHGGMGVPAFGPGTKNQLAAGRTA